MKEANHKSTVQGAWADGKFADPDTTADGKRRAWVKPGKLTTLWFNTGTLCNLECVNCYIESSPLNDRLVYISTRDVCAYLDEIEREGLGTEQIGFTGGEPFMNPQMLPILRECLVRGYRVLVLTNGMKPMMNRANELLELVGQYGEQLEMRVSLDHYREQEHARERGPRAWRPAIAGLKWLSENGFRIAVAGRTVWGETEESMRQGFANLFATENILLDAHHPERLLLFPEMDESVETPEITTECWGILGVSPDDMMCASSRMVVKRKGQARASVAACTLLPYAEDFDLGQTLREALRPVKLNHPHCAKFCVLGGGSCSG